ncbi:hypothetical protein N7467_003003 [Penicillium canescens]|nr:hypothetical protein N7467_003003 [Penicillium canescens]
MPASFVRFIRSKSWFPQPEDKQYTQVVGDYLLSGLGPGLGFCAVGYLLWISSDQCFGFSGSTK